MKNLFSLSSTLLALYMLLPFQSSAQIVNGDFETQFAGTPPSTELNIKGDKPYYSDQLPNWSVTSSATGMESNNASFLAINGAPSVNTNSNTTFGGTFSPHNNSTGCVGIKRSFGYPYYDGLITQKLSTPLQAGHSYHFSYFAMRRPVGFYKCKLALSVVNSTSTPALDGSPSVNAIVPTPTIVQSSDYIVSEQWVKVEGDFLVSQTLNDAWVVVGYDRAPEVYDASLANSNSSIITYILDDVSLTENAGGCSTLASGAITGNSTVCYNRTGDGRDRSHLVITTLSPAGTYYHGELVYDLTGEIVETIDGNTGGGFDFFLIGGGYTVGRFTLRVRTQNATCFSPWTTRAVNITNCSTSCSGRNCSTAQVSATSALGTYPNPASDELTVGTDGQEGQAIFYDARGTARKSFNLHVGNVQTTLNIRDLPAGVYHLRILYKGKAPIDQQIIVQH